MGARRRGRIIAFQSLYRAEVAGAGLEELFDFSWMDGEKPGAAVEDALLFARLLIQGTLENLPRIDEAIRAQLENWDFSRLNKVDLAILRMSVYCLLFQPDIPPTVTINEAVDISKSFGTEDSYRFVNGVLDAVRKGNLAAWEKR
jgi:N utilization substance protein B